MTARVSDDDLRRVLERADLFTLASAWIPGIKRRGKELVACCPFHGERSPSFTIFRKGSHGQAHFKCFGCGVSGDAVGLLMRLEGLDFPGAVRELGRRLGVPLSDPGEPPRPRPVRPDPPAPQAARRPPPPERPRRDEVSRALDIWREAGALEGSPAAAYLAGRGLDLALLAPWTRGLRCHPRLPYWHGARELTRAPALVGMMQGPHGTPQGVHLTWLAEGEGGWAKLRLADPEAPQDAELGGAKPLPAKKMRGVSAGAAVRFGPAAPVLHCGEGIETSLSVLQVLLGLPALAARIESGRIGVWALLSLGTWAGRGAVERRPRPHPERPGRLLPTPRPDEAPTTWLPQRAGPKGERLPAHGLVEAVWCADGDSGDRLGAELLVQRGVARLQREGTAVRVARAPDGEDFNDWLRRRQRERAA